MCIIAAKPAGIEMPSEETLINMWLRNSDGAGVMYAVNGMVHIEKGFMKYEEFEKCIEALDKKYGLKKLPMVMHLRITTHGGTCAENCHPFPITDSLGKLRKSKQTATIAVAHNGIIDITTRKNVSDTMEYIASQLAPLSKGVPRFYENKHLMQMIENATDSKLAFMTGNGRIYYIGDFIEDGGIMYSNTSYKKTDSWRDFSYGGWTMENWEHNTGMNNYYFSSMMWLDETAGEYVRLRNGDLVSGEYAISKYNTVYGYDFEEDGLIYISGAEAFTSEGRPLKYDEDSKLTTQEIVIYKR